MKQSLLSGAGGVDPGLQQQRRPHFACTRSEGEVVNLQ